MDRWGETLHPTAAVWLTEQAIAVTTLEGGLFVVKVGLDSQNVPYMDQATQLFYEADCSIWDMVCLKKQKTLFIAQDNGQVLQFDC